MNIINSIPRRAPKCISVKERAMELEQKPKCSSYPDESSYYGPEHATLYLDYTIAHIKIDNIITARLFFIDSCFLDSHTKTS